MTWSVCLSVGWSVGRSDCNNFPKGQENTLPCSYRSTCWFYAEPFMSYFFKTSSTIWEQITSLIANTVNVIEIYNWICLRPTTTPRVTNISLSDERYASVRLLNLTNLLIWQLTPWLRCQSNSDLSIVIYSCIICHSAIIILKKFGVEEDVLAWTCVLCLFNSRCKSWTQTSYGVN